MKLGGRWNATPLLGALLFLELSDVIFAVDSVPAIFAISREPLVVFTSNLLAILGLRAMSFMLADASTDSSSQVRPGVHSDLRLAENGVAERRVRREVFDQLVARHHRRVVVGAPRRLVAVAGEARSHPPDTGGPGPV